MIARVVTESSRRGKSLKVSIPYSLVDGEEMETECSSGEKNIETKLKRALDPVLKTFRFYPVVSGEPGL